MKTYIITLLSILLVLSSCSNENETFENPGNDTSDIIEIKSMEDFYSLLNDIQVPEEFNLSSILPNEEDKEKQTKVSWAQRMVNGYKTNIPYSNKQDLVVRITDFQTADRLGVKANTTYYFTAYQTRQELILESNHRFSPFASPNCGMVPGVDFSDLNAIIKSQRGYQAAYLSSQNRLDMLTCLVSFRLSRTTNTYIWFPTSPDRLEWEVKILIL